ncbi:MAG: HAMP domain-containing histidine kinase [Bacteroidales bacterium]|nr:HAMP domain-containing histidine kinase [Bacteroidales bacterium]
MKTVSEASMTTFTAGEPRHWDLRVTCTPMEIEGHEFFVVSLQDIAAEKRLAALERIFFHDILNTASGLNGLLTVLRDEKDPVQTNELLGYSEEASRTIIDEISMFRQLRAAESGDLKTELKTVDSLDFLKSVAARNSYHNTRNDISVNIDSSSSGVETETDPVLLQRVLTNLLKNAVEASKAGSEVVAGTRVLSDRVLFFVRNNGVIPEGVREQIFQRSFSTKGASRGLGTYSVKLLTEKYLKGKASFISNHSEGTVFTIELGIKFPVQP